jgi:hypothetical protein
MSAQKFLELDRLGAHVDGFPTSAPTISRSPRARHRIAAIGDGPLGVDSVEKLIYQAHVILQATAGVVVNPHET